jgi:hypothetical protein
MSIVAYSEVSLDDDRYLLEEHQVHWRLMRPGHSAEDAIAAIRRDIEFLGLEFDPQNLYLIDDGYSA